MELDRRAFLRSVGAASVLFSLEVLLGVVTPMVMLLMAHVRQTPSLLFTAAMLIVLGSLPLRRRSTAAAPVRSRPNRQAPGTAP